MIMSHPGRIRTNAVTNAMTSQYDFMPTLLDYLNLSFPPDETFPGRSFKPVLLNKTDENHEHLVVYSEYGPVRMIRTNEWKYTHRYPFGQNELYHLVDDPGERKNLVDDEPKASLVAELRQRLSKWLARYVRYDMDGTRFPVSGGGQLTKISTATPGENCFQCEGRILMTDSGFPAPDRRVKPVW
jgi:arylsulfatase A-like enzyme